MRWVTDVKVKEIASALDVDVGNVEQGLEDGETVWSYIREHEWLAETDLRQWGEAQGIGPDRMNIALDVLSSSKRARRLNISEPVAVFAAGDDTPGGLHGFSKEELVEIAAVRDIKGRTKMSKEELIRVLEETR